VAVPLIQTMADETERFCGRWFTNRPRPAVLVITGNSGVGKTHVAQAVFAFSQRVAFAAWERGGWSKQVPASLLLPWPEVCDGFKAGNYGVLEDAFTVSLLILDDIGAEHDPSKNAVDKLCQILSRRERMFTLVTTNIEPAAWPSRFDVRIADRLLRNSVIVDLPQVDSYALSQR
jgi:DNA replication protein DnaC